jgi:hypothetical protein
MRVVLYMLIALAVIAAIGCSRVGIVYNTADFFIERYADDYLSLDSGQMASWRPALKEAFARHRQEELPYLAAFFDDLDRAAREGFDASRVECLVGSFEDVYRRHFRLAVELTAPLLASLSTDQVRSLEARFAKDNEEDQAEDSGAERRKRKRAERWAESAEWWIGPLSDEQHRIIRDVTAAMPDTAADWVAYRSAEQAGLIRLLDAKSGEPEIRRYLDNWLVNYRDLPPKLRGARLEIRRQVVQLFVGLDASFNAAQKAHFEDRLKGLRDDFMDLQKRPRMAAIKCTAPG